MKKENRDKIVALRHDLHCHPELSMQEQETKNRLITFIKENIQLEVIDRGNWFYVQYTTKRQSEMPEADTKPPHSVQTLMHCQFWKTQKVYPTHQKIPESATNAGMTDMHPHWQVWH